MWETEAKPIQKIFKSKDLFQRMEDFELDPITLNSNQLDFMYFNDHAYNKEASSLAVRTLEDDDTYEANADALAVIIWERFKLRWQKLAATMTAEYNPINNYEMVEEASETRDLTNTDDTTVTTDYGKTLTTESEASAEQNNSAYGFNSTYDVPTDKQEGVNNVSGSETYAGRDTDTVDGTKTESGTITRTLTRSGNIGVTTSQQMLESERNLWQFDLINIIFTDIDSILCLKVY